MNERITHAMILSAGLGTRLAPITQRIPKPLVPALNCPNLLFTIFLLKRIGISHIIINLHHLPEAIESFLGDGTRLGLSISYSKEDKLLGTGGGLKKVEPFFRGRSLILINCDFISDVNLSLTVERHFNRRAIATMVLYENKKTQHLYSSVGVNELSNLCSLPSMQMGTPSRSGIFTGIHVLGPQVFDYLNDEPSGISETLYPRLMKHHPTEVFGDFMIDSLWFDTGDNHTLLETSVELLSLFPYLKKSFAPLFDPYEEIQPMVWAFPGTKLSNQVRMLGPVLLGEGVSLSPGSVFGPSVVVGERTVVEPNSHVKRTVIMPGAVIEMGSRLENALIFEKMVIPA